VKFTIEQIWNGWLLLEGEQGASEWEFYPELEKVLDRIREMVT
jgi:hypothetical protein